MRELPAGSDAVLLDFAGEPDPATAVGSATTALRRAIDRGILPARTDVLPSERTILVQAELTTGIDVLGIHRALRAGPAPEAAVGSASSEVRIPVRYDGPDLTEVAAALGVDADEVIRMHTGPLWRVQFMGFAPGFGYLVPADEPDHPFVGVRRRDEARTRVPAGAVALAAGYSAVYPRESPGGWQLIGRTDTVMWDERSTPPALLEPGAHVRFVRSESSP